MRGRFFPIMIGCYDKADKCTAIAKDKKFGGYSLFVCGLKEKQDYGTEVKKENVGKVACHLHFCKLEAAQAFRDGVNQMVQMWEEEQHES